MVWRWGAVTALVALGGCASIVSGNQSTVQVTTDPGNARCILKGHGFSTSITTPASVVVPASAAPVIVTCSAEGRRPTSYTLDATSDGWIWGNSALVVVTGGAAVLGLLVDESRDAGMIYSGAVNYQLDAERPRSVLTHDRRSGGEMSLQAR